MTYISAPLQSGSVPILSIIVDAARRWREARDTGLAVQPHLFATLADEGCGILAPVLDSLLHLFEVVLRRPLQTGSGEDLSNDEALLLDLLAGAKQRKDCLGSGRDMARAFDAALISARIMVRKAFALPAEI